MTAPIPQSVDTLASGRTSTAPFITVIKDRAPTGNDGINQTYQIGQRWIDTSSGNAEWFLLSFISMAGVVQANWVLLQSGTSTLETLTGNSGPAVTPDGANNINVVGDGTTGLLFAGASHTLTGTLNNIPNSALAHSSITLIDGTGITITGSPVSLGGAATINASDIVPTSFTTDSGVATPSAHNLNILGTGGITTSGSGSTVTIIGPGYSTGSFTPGIAFGGASVGITYTAQAGSYTKIGNIVFVTGYIVINNVGSSTGAATVTGLPITVGININYTFCATSLITLTASYTDIFIVYSASTTTGAFYQAGSGQSESPVTNTSFANTSSIKFTGFYVA